MKVNDVFVGLFFLAVGVFVTAYAWTLHPPRHLAYGPGFVPSLIGIGLMLVGGAIGLTALRTMRAERPVSWPGWSASPRGPLRFLAVPAAIAAYIVLADDLGFLLTSTIIVVAMLVIAGVHPLKGIAVGLLSSTVLTALFASILHVPLPWGPLRSVSGWLIW